MEGGEPKPEVQMNRSMTEEETLAFLKEWGVVPWDRSKWKRGDPVLYVLEEEIRQDDKIYKDIPKNRRPNVARIDNPLSIEISPMIPEDERDPKNPIYDLRNPSGGQVDYYSIDLKTKRSTVEKTSNNGRTYFVRKNTLFLGKDQLFRKSIKK